MYQSIAAVVGICLGGVFAGHEGAVIKWLCNDFDISSDQFFARIAPYSTTHQPCDVLYFVPMLIGW